MVRITPKNWKAFQHYGNRKPPWIKLHRSLLDDFAFACLPLASKALAPCLWLLASEREDAVIEATIDEIAFRVRMTPAEVRSGIKGLIDKGFFLDASNTLAERKQSASLDIERETEKEVEKEKEREGRTRGARLAPDWKPTGEDVSFAEQLGVQWQGEADRFRDYWIAQPGQKGVKADWSGTWRNWIRRAAEQKPRGKKSLLDWVNNIPEDEHAQLQISGGGRDGHHVGIPDKLPQRG